MHARSIFLGAALLAGCASVPPAQRLAPSSSSRESAKPEVAVIATSATSSERERPVARRARRPRSSWRPRSSSELAASGDRHGEPLPPQDSPWWKGSDGLAFAGSSAEHPERIDMLEHPLGEQLHKLLSKALCFDRRADKLTTAEFIELIVTKILCAPLGGIDLGSIWDDFMERYEHVSDRRELRAKLLDEANGGAEPEDDGPTPAESLDAYDAYLRATHREPPVLPGEKPPARADTNR